jgi:hypothetical protein
MLITEISDNLDNYHKLDIISSRFFIYNKHLRRAIFLLKDYKLSCIQNNIYTQWVEILNDIDEQIIEFIQMAKLTIDLINIFEKLNRNYISKNEIIKMVRDVSELRRGLN